MHESDEFFQIFDTFSQNILIQDSFPLSDVASGSSDDYSLGAVGVSNAYTIEVRDTGKHGFVLPPREILPNNIEVWAGFQAMLDGIMNEMNQDGGGGGKKKKKKQKKKKKKKKKEERKK